MMSNYSNLSGHHSMFFDKTRNDIYEDAIKRFVNKDSKVMDLGSGLGLHGLLAHKYGAKIVYLVEPETILITTKKVIESNGLSSSFKFINKKIEDVKLKDKVDCIISVFTGNFLLTEDLLPSLFFARDNFLKSGGKLIPDRAKMFAVPVSATTYYDKYIDCWVKDKNGFNLDVLREKAVNTVYYENQSERTEEFLAEPTEILEMNFMNEDKASCDVEFKIDFIKDGTCHGFLGWFDARVGNKWLSTSPKRAPMHWRQAFFPLRESIQVYKGQSIIISLNRPEFGEWTWSMDFDGYIQKHSTFFLRNDLFKSSLTNMKIN